MDTQIKHRIEQIRRGEVPEGYKKTKVGIVPADWQEHKLSHYLTVNNDKNTDLKYTKDDVCSISGELGIVNQIELLGRSYAGVSVAPYGIVYPNDVVYTKSPLKANPYGIIKTNKLGVTGIVSTLYAIFHCNNNVSPDYVQLYFESDHNLNNYLYPIVNIGAKHDMKISDEGSLRGTVVFPPLPEQEKIAAILQTQDKVIELQQKKIDELKRLKKVYLSKMFPKKGCNVPEIRFPGFTDPWEQRKVSDVAEICTGGTPSTGIEKYWYPKEIPWLSSGEVHKKYITYTDNKISVEGMNNSSARMIPENSVLIALAGQGKTRGTVAINRIPLTTNQSIAAMAFSNEVVPEFVFCNLESRYEEIRRMSSGDGSRGGLNKQIIGEMEIPYTSKEEQTKIGAYFFNLDNLITLHQRKCDEEKQKKKALMQLLLTGIVRVEVKQ